MNHRARKRFGQNFLRDPGVVQRIARAVHPRPDQHLVEIGPGEGALTAALLETGCRLDAIELDRDLIVPLQAQFAAHPRFQLHQGDALQFDLSSLGGYSERAGGERRLRVVGNLPYNISTPLIFHLLAQQAHIVDMHFMLQREVVARLAAAPGSKEYGRLSVMAQYFCQVQPLFDVPPEAFQPRPRVQSAVVQLVPHQALAGALPCPARDVSQLQALLRAAFNQRRKTLRNSLRGLLSEAQIAARDIDPSQRPENLTLQQFVALSDQVAAQHSTQEI